jgi:hypothetical protein
LSIKKIHVENIHDNVTVIPKNSFLKNFIYYVPFIKKILPSKIKQIIRSYLFTNKRPNLTTNERSILIKRYLKEDIFELEIILNRTLDSWKK